MNRLCTADAVPKPPSSLERTRFDDLWTAKLALEGNAYQRLTTARALIFCNLPYRSIADRSVTRTARVGARTNLSVTFTTIDEGVPLPFGSDRALFAWIQSKALQTGFVSFKTLTEFLDAFGLGRSGREYERFRQRVTRLESLAITLRFSDDNADGRVNLQPIRRSLTPKDFREARARLSVEESDQHQLALLSASDSSRYGFELDSEFWDYLRANPVPLPLPLMRLFHDAPQAWDFTAFVLYRCYIARSRNVVPWPELLEQMGAADSNPHRLRQRLERVLAEIQVTFPKFPARFLPGLQGLSVEPWRPSTALTA